MGNGAARCMPGKEVKKKKAFLLSNVEGVSERKKDLDPIRSSTE